MRGSEKLRQAFLRWDHLLTAVVLGLPFVLLMLLGLLWLIQHSAILWFFAASLLIAMAMFLTRAWLRHQRAGDPEPVSENAEMSVEPDPDWLPREKQVFTEVSQHIASLTRTAQPWEALPEMALDVINRTAAGLGGKNKSALHFTLPEALLLMESTAGRYREHLRSKLPFSDRISLASLYWLWRQRDRANLLWKLAQGGGRVARFAINPAAGVLKELEQIMSGGNSSYMTENMLGVMQAVLLEEVAYGAIELYSGRLRFSEAELLQIELASGKADHQRLALPDAPLRIVFVGQISAGKSSLVNALSANDRAEIDAAPTTQDLVTYQTELAGVACHFVDSEGLDGTSENLDRMLGELTEADMVVWVIRANRSAREIDKKLNQQLDSWFSAHPRRRKPVIIAVATAMDKLLGEGLSAGGELSESAQQTLAAAMAAISRDMQGLEPVPVSLGPVSWNLESVLDAIRVALPESQRVQRNRRRVEGARRESRLRSQARKGGRGVKKGAKMVGRRLSRTLSASKDKLNKSEH